MRYWKIALRESIEKFAWVTLRDGRRIHIDDAEENEFLEKVSRDPEIQNLRASNQNVMKTSDMYQKPDGTYIESRAKLHEEIVQKTLNPNAVSEQPRVAMLLGLPASGKTKVLKKQLGGEWTTVDADQIKSGLKRKDANGVEVELIPGLPEYNGRNASVVHKESGHVAETMLMKRALQNKHNIILDWTGKNSEKTLKRVKELKDSGYKVDMYYVEIPPVEAGKRALTRFKEEGRFVDPEYIIKEVGFNPKRTYRLLKESGLISTYKKYDNNVPFGTPAKLIEEHYGD